jgi:hypothetical protein
MEILCQSRQDRQLDTHFFQQRLHLVLPVAVSCSFMRVMRRQIRCSPLGKKLKSAR